MNFFDYARTLLATMIGVPARTTASRSAPTIPWSQVFGSSTWVPVWDRREPRKWLEAQVGPCADAPRRAPNGGLRYDQIQRLRKREKAAGAAAYRAARRAARASVV